MTAANGSGPARAYTDVPPAGSAHTARATSPAAPATALATAAPATASAAPAPRTAQLPLTGKIVGIDPGHNGRNITDPGSLAWQVWNGREWENCDTTGAETNSGYTEALFNFRVAE